MERKVEIMAGRIRKKSVLFVAFLLLLFLARPAGSSMLLVSLGDGGAHVDLVVNEPLLLIPREASFPAGEEGGEPSLGRIRSGGNSIATS
jgi:hypothetical protein